MGLINRIKSAVGLERREVNPNDPWAHFAALRTGSVTPESAQSVAAVYAAVGVISEAIGSLPLRLYRRGDDSRTPADDHPLHRCLHREPNEHQSSQEFIEWMTGAMLLHGNAYARVIRGWDGHPVLQMCAANAVVTKDPTGARKLDKARATGRIDGMQALAMAIGVASRHEESQAYSGGEFVFV